MQDRVFMATFAGPHSVGLVQTLLVMGVLYFCFMMFGVFMIRTPPPNWKPTGYTPVVSASGMITPRTLGVSPAVRTRQFWLLWIVLCTNVTAGIGILEQASPIIQEMFKGTHAARGQRQLRARLGPHPRSERCRSSLGGHG